MKLHFLCAFVVLFFFFFSRTYIFSVQCQSDDSDDNLFFIITICSTTTKHVHVEPCISMSRASKKYFKTLILHFHRLVFVHKSRYVYEMGFFLLVNFSNTSLSHEYNFEEMDRRHFRVVRENTFVPFFNRFFYPMCAPLWWNQLE